MPEAPCTSPLGLPLPPRHSSDLDAGQPRPRRALEVVRLALPEHEADRQPDKEQAQFEG
jgi:hypothetical protein